MSEFYNTEDKEWFMSTINNYNVRMTYKVMFEIIAPEEELNQKDFYNFSPSEVDLCMYRFDKKTISNLESSVSLLRRYVKWALSNGKVKSGKSNLIGFHKSQLLNYVNEVKYERQFIFGYDEMFSYINLLKTYRDGAIIVLLFEGVFGFEASEIRDLKSDDVDFYSKTVKVKRNDQYVELTDMSPKSFEYLLESTKEEGVVAIKQRGDILVTFKPSDYFIKSIKSLKTGEGLSYSLVRRAAINLIDVVKDGLGKVLNLTPTTVWKSGLFFWIKRQEADNIGETLEEIIKRGLVRYGRAADSIGLISEYKEDYLKYKEVSNISNK